MESNFFTSLDPDVYKVIVVVFLIILVMRFILVVIKKLLDHKLKTRIIEKGIPEEFSKLLLQTEKSDKRVNNIKWFLILISTGIGLLIANSFLPLGIHSIAIVIISISLGFLIYSFYLKSLNE